MTTTLLTLIFFITTKLSKISSFSIKSNNIELTWKIKNIELIVILLIIQKIY